MTGCRRAIHRMINGNEQRRCAHCNEWFALDQFYSQSLMDAQKIRSWCKQCYIWGVVNRKRVQRDPFGPLLACFK